MYIIIYIYTSILFYFSLANVQAKVKFSLKVVEKKNGKPFIEIKDKKVNLEFGSVRLHFSNLFNGNKEMGKHFSLQMNWFRKINCFMNIRWLNQPIHKRKLEGSNGGDKTINWGHCSFHNYWNFQACIPDIQYGRLVSTLDQNFFKNFIIQLLFYV